MVRVRRPNEMSSEDGRAVHTTGTRVTHHAGDMCDHGGVVPLGGPESMSNELRMDVLCVPYADF